MNAYEVKIEWDEDGCHLILETSEGIENYRLTEPEQAYDAVKAGILPWLMERDQALQAFRCKDPEGDWIRDVALGAMGVGESLEAAAAALDSIDLSRKMERER